MDFECGTSTKTHETLTQTKRKILAKLLNKRRPYRRQPLKILMKYIFMTMISATSECTDMASNKTLRNASYKVYTCAFQFFNLLKFCLPNRGPLTFSLIFHRIPSPHTYLGAPSFSIRKV
eukprot:UN24956